MLIYLAISRMITLIYTTPDNHSQTRFNKVFKKSLILLIYTFAFLQIVIFTMKVTNALNPELWNSLSTAIKSLNILPCTIEEFFRSITPICCVLTLGYMFTYRGSIIALRVFDSIDIVLQMIMNLVDILANMINTVLEMITEFFNKVFHLIFRALSVESWPLIAIGTLAYVVISMLRFILNLEGHLPALFIVVIIMPGVVLGYYCKLSFYISISVVWDN